MGELKIAIGVKEQAAVCECGEGACVAGPDLEPSTVHATRFQRDIVLGPTIGSPQAANPHFDRAAENPNT
jgi:hypothetical protein